MTSPYKPFPKSYLIREWGKLLELDRQEVIDLEKEWKEIQSYNSKLCKELQEKKDAEIKEIVEYLKSKEINVVKHKTKKYSLDPSYLAWFQNNIVKEIERKYPYYHGSIPVAHIESKEVNGIMLSNNKSPTTLLELYDRIKPEYNHKRKRDKEKDQLLVKSIEYAVQQGLNISYYKPDDIILAVEKHAKQKYLEKNYPPGTIVPLKGQCHSCDTYISGEHRCSCGNRRIDLVIEGNLLEGFMCYPKAY